MPRGYLKNVRGDCNRKCALGGGSHRTSRRKLTTRWRKQHDDQLTTMTAPHSEHIESQHSESYTQKQEERQPTYKMGDCAICYENRPCVTMSKACSWHDAACFDCIRKVHVTNAQKSSRNYPLRCFHPLCSAQVHASQLIKHKLLKSEKEATQHHRMTEMAKGKDKTTVVVHCPHCDHPRSYKEANKYPQEGSGKHRVFTCRECKENYSVSPLREVIQAMINFGEARSTDEFAQCPECQVLIVKDYGDDSMHCSACNASFSWSHAKRQSPAFKYPFARPGEDPNPIDQLYLYW
mmetsp:Transcript_20875/g.45262  ORF Transcript_20875/g.45262 Transcript_20875/m.45262 type:complete len:293 (+) Transcript_20875:91-969(+)|eukprot:CAMPEP_0168785272 /NCGR_PEP_ID=MMETSP0725-20121227/10662_1 /TAXON_ID=265536 /ORGANISM="Amphiprora sp., Strain CCMP467" /LENGTH=292 /DNA_ID=CAMNT_0008835367 /DNA_START=30 /DNA_END=908 /DNA_ORIENTATION=-